jgi:hypothetical protein
MNRRHQKHQNSEHQRHLRDLRRGEADTAQQVAKSQEAIEDSLSLLQRGDSTAEQKSVTGRPPSEGRGPDRTARWLKDRSRHGWLPFPCSGRAIPAVTVARGSPQHCAISKRRISQSSKLFKSLSILMH